MLYILSAVADATVQDRQNKYTREIKEAVID